MRQKERIKRWIIAIGVAFILIMLSNKSSDNPNKTTILVNAPKSMIQALENTLEELDMHKDYKIEYTEDSEKANFVVEEGLGKKGELIAYSPIIAVFNSDDELQKRLIDENIFVISEVDPDEYDFDFKKIIDQIVNDKTCEFKVYYPSKNSATWEEFYHFLLFTVNDGYYPKTAEEIECANQTIDAFLNSKNAEPINNNTLERSNGFAQNSIYFMAYTDLARVYDTNRANYYCRVMYPKTVVYHNYYASFDETGKILYDTLNQNNENFLFEITDVGYYYLRRKGYITKYNNYTITVSSYIEGVRQEFNGVEIPGAELNSFKED